MSTMLAGNLTLSTHELTPTAAAAAAATDWTTVMPAAGSAAAALNVSEEHAKLNIIDFGPKRDALHIVVPVSIIYSLIFVSGIIGNISTCIVIKKNRSMHTATNYYLFTLAVSDFLLLLSGVPQEMYFIWSKYPYVFGEVFCIVRGLLAETSANATVLTITAFTVERYIAICHPFLGQKMSKLSRAIRIIVLIWLVSVLTALPQAAQFGIADAGGIERCMVVRVIIAHSFELATFVFFFAPMTIILVLYLLIGLHLYRAHFVDGSMSGGSGTGVTVGTLERGDTTDNRLRRYAASRSSLRTGMKATASDTILYRYSGGSGGGGGSGANGNQLSVVRGRRTHGTRRVLKMLVAVVICFFLCWAPFHAQRLIAVYATATTTSQHEVIYTVMTYISGVLYYLSTCINPLLYNLMSNKFREAFKAVLFGVKPKGSLNSRQALTSRRLRRTTTSMLNSSQRDSSETELQAKNALLQVSISDRWLPKQTAS